MNVANAGEQVLQRFGMQREIDPVDILAAERGVHDGRRERLRHRVSGNAIDLCGRVHLIEAISALKLLGGDLSGGGFFVGGQGTESEDAAGAGSQDAADDALLAHAHSHQRVLVAMPLQELHHGHIVVESGCGADNLVEVGGIGRHFCQGFIQLLSGAEVVERQDNRRTGAKFSQLHRFETACGLQLNVD